MNTSRYHVLRHILAALITVSMLMAAFPRPAQAATTCAERYTVREGDTKSSIARRFDMDWDRIADASDIDPADRIRPGQRLCIPELDEDERPNPSTRLRVSATHTALTLTISGLSQKKAVFMARVRDARVGVMGFTKLGKIKAKKGDTTKQSFTIPKELLKVLYLEVCIKNQSTDEMRCQTVIHP